MIGLLSVWLLLITFHEQQTLHDLLRDLGGERLQLLQSNRFAAFLIRVRVFSSLCFAAVALMLWQHRALIGFTQWIFFAFCLSARDTIKDLLAWFRTESWLHVVALLLVVVVGIFLRLSVINQSMLYDEVYTYLAYASRPFLLVISLYDAPNNHVLHTLQVHLSTNLLGDMPWAIRLPAFLAGICLPPAAYWAGRTLFGNSSGLLAAVLAAVSLPLIEFSVNARGYSLLCLITVLILAIAAKLLREGDKRLWTWFCLLSALGFYTVPVMLFPFSGVALWFLASSWLQETHGERGSSLRQFLWAMIAVGLLTALLYLPILLVSGPDSIFGGKFIAAQDLSRTLADGIPFTASLFDAWTSTMPFLFKILFLLALAATTALHHKTGYFKVPLFPVLVLSTVCIIVIHPPHLLSRIFLPLLPLLLVQISGTVAFIPKDRLSRKGRLLSQLGTLLIGLVLVVCILPPRGPLGNRSESELEGADILVERLRGVITPQDRILAVTPTDALLNYYFRAGGPLQFTQEQIASARPRILAVVNLGQNDTLQEILAKHSRLFPASLRLGAPQELFRMDEIVVLALPVLQ